MSDAAFMSAGPATLLVGLVGDEVCILHSSMGVEVVAVSSAPGGEPYRIKVRLDDNPALLDKPLSAFLGCVLPFVESCRQDFGVVHEGFELFVVLPTKPDDADDLGFHGVSLGQMSHLTSSNVGGQVARADGESIAELSKNVREMKKTLDAMHSLMCAALRVGIL